MTTSDVMTQNRSARQVLAWSRITVEPALRAAIDTLGRPDRIMEIE